MQSVMQSVITRPARSRTRRETRSRDRSEVLNIGVDVEMHSDSERPSVKDRLGKRGGNKEKKNRLNPQRRRAKAEHEQQQPKQQPPKQQPKQQPPK